MTTNNAAKWQEELDNASGRDAFREQAERFRGFKIVTTLTDEGFAWEVYDEEPCFCTWYKWAESEDFYTSHTAAVEAAKRYIDNYEPSQD